MRCCRSTAWTRTARSSSSTISRPASTDAKVTQDLIETLADGQNGYTEAADRMSGEERPDLAARFHDLADHRKQMADDLRSVAARYGDHVDSDGSALAGLHRGWMGLKDALTGTDADAVIDAAVSGEEHAVSEFEKALDEDVSAELRSKIETQLASICSASARRSKICRPRCSSRTAGSR